MARTMRLYFLLTFLVIGGVFQQVNSQTCSSSVALGMEDDTINDEQLTASSYITGYFPKNGRYMSTSDNFCWIPDTNSGCWFQVDFLANTVIDGILTQTRRDLATDIRRIKAFTLQYSYDGSTFYYYEENGSTKTIYGNTNAGSTVTNTFGPIFARFLRLNMKTFAVKPALRAEYYGCYNEMNTCTAWVGAVSPTDSGWFFITDSSALTIDENTNRANTGFCLLLATNWYSCHHALGMESGDITDDMVTASSESSSNFAAKKARPGNSKYWRPSADSINEWLQIQLPIHTYISAFSTEKSPNNNNGLLEYVVAFSHDGENFLFYQENGENKIFSVDTIGRIQGPAPYRYIRFYPISWDNYIGVRVEVYGCTPPLANCDYLQLSYGNTAGWFTVNSGSGNEIVYCLPYNQNFKSCIDALGMESLAIRDDQLSASSVKDDNPDFGAAYGRLNDARTAGAGWIANVNDANQWLKVDTEALTTITKILIQSRGGANNDQMVSTFKVEYSFDDASYTVYKESNAEVVFQGSVSSDVIVHSYLTTSILVRYIKIVPVTYTNAVAMRIELSGCVNSIAPSSSVIEQANLIGGWFFASDGSIQYLLNKFSSSKTLYLALGMEDSSIADNQITASSNNGGSNANYARFNHNTGWTAGTADTDQYLLIDFTANTYISKVILQGASSDSYTESYYLYISRDGVTYNAYNYNGAQKLLTGNTGDGDLSAEEYLQEPLFGRYLKINPQSWTGSKPSLRVELYGDEIALDTCDEWKNSGYTTAGHYFVQRTSESSSVTVVYCEFTKAFTSCSDYATAGFTDDGYFLIYPQGTGIGLLVRCSFSSLVNIEAHVTMTHDRIGGVTLSSSSSSPGSVVHTLDYGNSVDIADITAMAAASSFCYQYLIYESNKAKIWDSGTQNVWWEDNAGNKMAYWAGADPSGSSGCRCGQLSNCVDDDEKCNSDSEINDPAFDGGYITDKSVLPVTSVKLGGFDGSNSATYSLGELSCLEAASALPASCQAAFNAGDTTPGLYLLDPDGNGPLNPVIAQCSEIGNAIVTEITHDFVGSVEIVEYSGAGSFAKDISYTGDIPSLIAMVASSTACSQYLEMRCFEAKLLRGDESWWVSSDGTKKDHWSGTTMSGKCACGATGSCYKDSRNCNCDEGASYWMQDKGYITSRTDLPVSQIRAGDTSSSKLGFITLGSLKCYERVGPLVQTCYDVKQSGETTNGYYLLDPDGASGTDAFIAECDLNFNSTHAVTIYNHDSESREHVVDVSGKKDYIRSVVYENMDVEQLESQFTLASSDYYQTCKQYIKYECYDARLLDSSTSEWKTFKGESKTYWGGANGQDLYCSCGLDGTCIDTNKLCNCDSQTASWLEDDGYLIDYLDEVLPVTQLRFGDTGGGVGSEEGYHTLGKLMCYVSESEY
ncbi:uncharacterized protein [Asterias amurensis]|uniref:uncharacterized protein isoform X2 n=1 Tax=Asterias amurensis TaxID=7602 RepID=UPI003AB1754C